MTITDDYREQHKVMAVDSWLKVKVIIYRTVCIYKLVSEASMSRAYGRRSLIGPTQTYSCSKRAIHILLLIADGGGAKVITILGGEGGGVQQDTQIYEI